MSDPRFGRASGYIVHGVVVDNNDPWQAGNLKVRWNLGSAAQDKISDDDLPWTRVMHPSNDPALKQTGGPHTGLVKGSRVVGMPLGADGQDFVIIGSMLGMGSAEPDQQATPDSEMPRPGKQQKNADINQPRYGDVNDVAVKLGSEDIVRTSIVTYAQDEGGPDRKPADYADLPDSAGWVDKIA